MELTTFVSAILGQMSGISKCHRRFMLHIIELFLSLRSRYTISNLVRYGSYLESSYHEWFRKWFDYERFNEILISEHAGRERFIAFDPSYFPKSGKHTPGVNRFWSGCANAVKWGLEVCNIAVIDVANHTGFHYALQQTLKADIGKDSNGTSKLYTFYASVLTSRKNLLQAFAGKIVVADAFFSNKTFHDELWAAGFVLLSRLQKRGKMRYPYIGEQKAGRGRKKVYGAKVDVNALDMQHFTCFSTLTEGGVTEKCFGARVYIDALKTWAQVVVVQKIDPQTGNIKSTQIYFCTDTSVSPQTVLIYYRLRFQIEFLFRDAKQHLGLTQCQSTDAKVLHNHWNLALTVLNIAKAFHHFAKDIKQRKAFSIENIKNLYINRLYLNTFISAFGISTDNEKNSLIMRKLFTKGNRAA